MAAAASTTNRATIRVPEAMNSRHLKSDPRRKLKFCGQCPTCPFNEKVTLLVLTIALGGLESAGGTLIEVQFIGSGDAFGSGGRFQTCVLLRNADGPLLIDCGASSLIAMKRVGIAPSTIAAVVLTHLHGDHFAGIPFLILDGQFSGRTAPVSMPT